MTGWEAEGIQHYEECVALGIDDQFRTPQAELASKKGNSGINVVELKTLQAVDANRLASDQLCIITSRVCATSAAYEPA